ncbi:class I SAM-dependent methyltransferase [Candidatus Kryptobacter tengchongensis]|uniref:Ubiquinone/menaquinone biosynthesis C-methylase UbiE n=1 Tax=Kryptobacter tengchongensis TaxID=1643429 RepID=A0A656D2L8_KRYT1|nr:class I SAM-dependent methyltransferase [Candidatus Kryptobacter tengchongensis]CUS97932.1 Ubiquinone/menaquinone biosynthesis C-methylase UbiE [Candidatus Kryptobacter tengchongensis]
MNISEERLYFNFDLFSQQEEYYNVNLQFIDRTLPVGKILSSNGLTIVDVACGTGLITSILLEKLQGKRCKIIGVDPNPAAIKIASDKVKSTGETEVEFHECFAQDLLNLITPQSVDVVYFCNAIHEIPSDKAKMDALKAIAGILKANGKLFINSTFTKESYTPDTLKFWGMLKLIAFQTLGGKRDKNAPSFEILSIDDYKEKLTNAGFIVNEINTVRVELSERAMLAICEYDAFVKGVFIDMENSDDFTLKQKSDALKLAVRTIIAQVQEKSPGLNPFARNWIEFSCEKA